MTIPTNILALIFVLSFLIVFHEGGHFLIAKLFKFPVEIFSLGFGKRLFGWKRNETDYRVSLIPLGGYVKVVGLGPDESDVVQGTAETSVTQPGTRFQRLLILFAGPGVNLVLAFLLTASAFLIGVEVAKYKGEAPVVKIVDRESPAEKAGIRAGDRIASISGKPVRTWEEVELETGLAPREELTVGIERDGMPITLRLTPEPRSKYDIGYTGLNPYIPAVVARIVPGYPGAKAGLEVGDRIVSVDGKPVVLYFEVVRFIREAASSFDKSGPKPIEMVVSRDGETKTLNVVPVKEGENWRIGFAPKEETILRRFSLAEAFAASWRENVRQVQVTGQIVGRLFRGTGSMRQFSGPIDIAKFSGEAARSGPSALILLMGVLSLQLGILNLLPIPLLDGGQIFVTLIEAVVRRDFSLKVKERLLQAGFVFLVLVMVTVLYFDVLKNVSF
jgi:regulator of sigma E protease